jgi:hypothetical protein
MGTELTLGSWSSLMPSERASLFLKVMTRAGQVQAISTIRHLAEDPLDVYFPEVIETMERKLKPAGEAVASEAIRIACTVMRCKKPEGDMLAGYLAILGVCPRDLLLPSIYNALSKETHHVLPTPGALMADANPRLKVRQDMLAGICIAHSRLRIARDWKRRGLGN